MILLLLAMSSLSLGDTRMFLSVLFPLKYTAHTMLLANVFNAFTESWNIRNDYVASLYGLVGCSWLKKIYILHINISATIHRHSNINANTNVLQLMHNNNSASQLGIITSMPILRFYYI